MANISKIDVNRDKTKMMQSEYKVHKERNEQKNKCLINEVRLLHLSEATNSEFKRNKMFWRRLFGVTKCMHDAKKVDSHVLIVYIHCSLKCHCKCAASHTFHQLQI